MGGDYTRFTFDPVKRYTTVLRQQGRVGIDADHNEAAEIADRRWRSETLDIIGRCVVPASTPDAFLITPTGPGAFTIGVGRAYVDGIQVENFGDPGQPLDPQGSQPTWQWDPILAERRWMDEVAYDEQPFLSEPPDLGDSPQLIYLDVWYREVDHLIDPGIREKALGGPDTATRLQVVWQVRALELGDADVECHDEIAAWDALTAPSAGRLTTVEEAPEPSENPCHLSPEGGYRGPENRHYLVEIHAIEGDGKAWLKWSRDHASVKTGVSAINGTDVTVESLGRDAMLRFQVGDWVEMIDERSDLDVSRSGKMAKIVEIREAERVIELDRPLGIGNIFDPTDEERLTRLVRWDHHGTGVDQKRGVIPVPSPLPPGFEIAIEDGIRIRLDLDPADGRFRLGDRWSFEARTADSSVARLVKAPPREVHHHYCRLAVVRGPEDVEDCRQPWPWDTDEGCCTVVVRPGEDIQKAVDSLPVPQGGCVCLKAGDHVIENPVVIERANVHFHGESPGARVIREGGLPVLQVSGSNVVVESVDLVARGVFAEFSETSADHNAAILLVVGAENVDFHRVGIQAVESGGFVVGALLRRAWDVDFVDCRFDGAPIGLVALSGQDLLVADSAFHAPFGFGGELAHRIGDRWGFRGVQSTAERTVVHRCRFDGFQTAVRVERDARDSRVKENWVERSPNGVWVGQDGGGAYAVEALAPKVVVSENTIEIPDPRLGGIRLAVPNPESERRLAAPIATVSGNRIESSIPEELDDLAVGVLVEGEVSPAFEALLKSTGLASGGDLDIGRKTCEPQDGVVVADNRITGPLDAIIVYGTRGIVIRDNHLETTDERPGSTGIHLQVTSEARVSGNAIRGFESGVFVHGGIDTEIDGNYICGGRWGVLSMLVWDPRVTGNVIRECRQTGCGLLITLGFARIAGNRILDCTWVADGHLGISVGLGVLGGVGQVEVVECQVVDTGVPPTGVERSAEAVYGAALLWIRESRVEGNVVSYRRLENQAAGREDRALVAVGWPENMEETAVGGTVMVLDNEFVGVGRSALVELGLGQLENLRLSFEKITFSNNRCLHRVERETERVRPNTATVWLLGEHQIVMGNHVKATLKHYPSFDFNNKSQVALVGNISTGDYLNVSPTPTPIGDSNIQLP